MVHPTETIMEQALTLPVKERAMMAHRLILSLDHQEETSLQTETLWQAEMTRRLQEVETGSVVCLPWDEVHSRLVEKILAKP
ncbi:MAG: addiction module protein [Magnetococcales bacterium]|nr:addiction module protein [Magnetococcales bacterium]